MLGVYDSMKKLIDKCDLYFEGHIISKELLLQNYADFWQAILKRSIMSLFLCTQAPYALILLQFCFQL